MAASERAVGRPQELTRAQLLEIQDFFIAEYSKESLQAELREAWANAGGIAEQQERARSQVLYTRQMQALTKWGISDVSQARAAFSRLELGDAEIQKKNAELARLTKGLETAAVAGTTGNTPVGSAHATVAPTAATAQDLGAGARTAIGRPHAAAPPVAMAPTSTEPVNSGDAVDAPAVLAPTAGVHAVAVPTSAPARDQGATAPTPMVHAPEAVVPSAAAPKAAATKSPGASAPEDAAASHVRDQGVASLAPTTRTSEPGVPTTGVPEARGPSAAPPMAATKDQGAAVSAPSVRASTAAPPEARGPSAAPPMAATRDQGAAVSAPSVRASTAAPNSAAVPTEEAARDQGASALASTRHVPLPQTYAAQNVAPTDGQLWVVIGGGDAGGIKVRAHRETNSREYKFRLQTGARVEQLELEGERLHYKRLIGDGPDFGWVSLTFKGSPLLAKLDRDDFPDEA